MSAQTICVSLDENNDLICTDEGGFCGEHNAKLLEITLSGEFASQGYDYLRLAFDTGGLRGTSLSNPITCGEDSPVYRIDNKIYCPLVQGLTASGTLRMQLCAYGAENGETVEIKKSGILTLTFKPSIMAQTNYEDIGAGVAEKVDAALRLVSALSAEVAFLRDNTVTELAAGDYVTLEHGVIGVDYADSINGAAQGLVTAQALRTYTDDRFKWNVSQASDLLSAQVTATLVGEADADCMGVYVGLGEIVVSDIIASGDLENMLFSSEAGDKYVLLVTTSDIHSVLMVNEWNFRAGKIYKVSGDFINASEVVTEIGPSGFAAMLAAALRGGESNG